MKHFQQDKEIGSWFGKLLPIKSMDICQHQKAIEPGRRKKEKGNMYLHQRVEKYLEDKLRVS